MQKQTQEQERKSRADAQRGQVLQMRASWTLAERVQEETTIKIQI